MSGKIALLLMFENEIEWVKLHIPIMLPAIDVIFAVDGGSNDGGDFYLSDLGAHITYHKFQWGFGYQIQYLLDHFEESPYSKDIDFILRLDPDEVMFPQDIDTIRETLERGPASLLHIRRINFVRDRYHYAPNLDTHRQWRAWRNNGTISYYHEADHLQLAHETPAFRIGMLGTTAEIDNAPIYHYGALRDPYFCHWRSLTYQALCEDKPLPKYDPVPMNWFPNQRYELPQPLDPEEIGARAPMNDTQAVPLNFHLDRNLAGDRTLENYFLQGAIEPPTPGKSNKALDFGAGGVSILSLAMKKEGWQVTAVDQEKFIPPAGIDFIAGDVLNPATLGDRMFGMIMCCSSIEHVGLAGRYGVTEDIPNGDLQAMSTLKNHLEPGGLFLLTVPVGKGSHHGSMHRIYDQESLSELIEGYDILTEKYWVKTDTWRQVSADQAFAFQSIQVSETDWQGILYSLGGLVLRKIS